MESNHALKDINKVFSINGRIYFNEDQSWFGIGAVLLIIPGFFAGIIMGIKNKNIISISLVIFGISFYFSEIWLRPGWDPYQGRYFILQIGILMPLCVYLFNDSNLSKIFQFFICLIVILTFSMAVLSNKSKPILGKKEIELKYQAQKTEYLSETKLQEIYRNYSLKFLYIIWDNLPFQKPLYYYDDTELRTFKQLKLSLSNPERC